MSFCPGCYPKFQENQTAHMDKGGCLYYDDVEESILDSSSIHDILLDEPQLVTCSEAIRVEPIGHHATSREDMENECCICYEIIGTKNNCVTQCGHKFCFKCIVMAMSRNNGCPCCRAPLTDAMPEDDIDDDESVYEVDELFDDDEDEDEEIPEADAEIIASRLEAEGFTMLDIVSLLLNRFSKTNARHTEDFVANVYVKFDEIQISADKEADEQTMFAAEDLRNVA